MIIGSFRGRGGKELDQHYVSLSYLHEPKGGILPAEEENPEAEPTDLGQDDVDDAGEGERRAARARSPQARSSEIAKRFSAWIREQRLAVLRGFGADDEEEEEDPHRQQQQQQQQPQQGEEGEEEEDEAVADDTATATPEVLGEGDVGARGAERENIRDEAGKESEESTAAAIGAGGESSATDGRDAEARGSADPPPREKDPALEVEEKHEDVEQRGEEDDAAVDGGPTLDYEPDEADAGDGRQGPDNDPPTGQGRGWLEGGGDGELVDAAQEPEASPHLPGAVMNSKATVVEVGAGKGAGAGQGGAVDLRYGDEMKNRREDAREGVLMQPPSPSKLQQQSTLRPPEGGEWSLDYFAEREKEEEEEEESAERTHTFHAFPPADTVTISRRGEPVDSVPNLRDDPNFTWEADGIG